MKNGWYQNTYDLQMYIALLDNRCVIAFDAGYGNPVEPDRLTDEPWLQPITAHVGGRGYFDWSDLKDFSRFRFYQPFVLDQPDEWVNEFEVML